MLPTEQARRRRASSAKREETSAQTPPREQTADRPSQSITDIQDLVKSRVLVYTSQRSIGPWDVPPLYKALETMGAQDELTVIVQSGGGFADDTFKIANLIREFAKRVTFVVPYYAKSSATMLCLSGDRILMGPISELGPTDPMMRVDERLITPTLPQSSETRGDPGEKQPRQRQMAAHALRDFLVAAGIIRPDSPGYDPEVLSVYITKGILNPFLLGDFERSTKMALQYTETLLSRYMFRNHQNGAAQAKGTAKLLCEGYYDHGYPIQRREARETLKLNVEDMPDDLRKRIAELMLEYDRMMESQKIATIIETSEQQELRNWAESS